VVERRQACAPRKGARRIRKMRRWYPAFAGVPLPSIFLRSPDGAKRNPGTMDQRNGRPGFRFAPSGLRNQVRKKESQAPPLPFPWTGPVSQFDVTVFCWRAFARRKNSGAETRRESAGVWHENPTQQLAQSTPSPQRGEGWGEGVRTSEQELGLPNPLILSFSPISAFTRVFDALWGRRDAASRSRRSSADVATIPRARRCAARARAHGQGRLRCRVVKPQ